MRAGPTTPESISVVIQGPVEPEYTKLVIESVRQHLPGAEIILSTWMGSDVSKLPAVDAIVYSKDPGSQLMSKAFRDQTAVQNNVNRQIVSSAAGIARSTRSMILKIRSDLVLTGANGFLDAFGVFDSFNPEFRFVQQRIIGNASGTRNPELYGVLFHPGDFFFFGTRADLEDFFSIPLYSDPRPITEVVEERSASKSGHVQLNASSKGLSSWMMEYRPEVYLFRSFLLQHGAPVDDFSCFLEYSESWRRMAMDYLLNQFVFLDDDQLGIRSLKIPNFERDGFSKNIDFACWRRAYFERFQGSRVQHEVCRRLAERSAGNAMSQWIKGIQVERPASGSVRAFLLRALEFAASILRVVAMLSPLSGGAMRLHRQLKNFRRMHAALGRA